MTSHYIDIHLLPDPEFSQAHLMNALYAKLHRALVQLQSSNIGVSFPGYSLHPKTLGQIMRLHGSESALQTLLTSDWLRGMRDHTQLSAIAAAPAQAEHRQLQRRQFKTSAERLRRRRMQRKGETAEQAHAAIPDHVERQPDLPFAQLRSSSTGQSFHLFLALSKAQPEPLQGPFNTYGLSTAATIPWF